MGLFNYIDTFFFISLGITFVLILLLVFHFKQQITSLEHKSDTMFEIINNIVQELNYMKSGHLVNSIQQYHNEPLHKDNEDHIIIQQQPYQSKQMFENRIVVSDDDESDDDADESDDDDVDSDDESDDESDDDDDEIIIAGDNENTESKIKVINIELGENIEINDIQTDNDIENENEIEETHIEDNFENDTTIIVTKLEGEHLENSENKDLVNNSSSNFKATKDYYARISMNELKTMVVTKGLVSDASKMKKIQLIQLLLENP
jgi:hypothetical protein